MNRAQRRASGTPAPAASPLARMSVDEIRAGMARMVDAMVAEGTPRDVAIRAVYDSWLRVATRQGNPLTGLKPLGA